MKADKDRALWVLLCVLVVIVLVLAALLLASGRPGAALAAVVGGGGAMLFSGGRPRPKRRRVARGGARGRAIHGGADSDFDPANIAAGADTLGFPPSQKTPDALFDLAAEHHGMREALLTAVTQYLTDRGTPLTLLTSGDTIENFLSTKPATGVPAPTTGWGGTDAEVIKAIKAFGEMCDIVRGNFGATGAGAPLTLPNAPWVTKLNGATDGRHNLWYAAWERMDDALKMLGGNARAVAAALAETTPRILPPINALLVDPATGIDLGSKATFITAETFSNVNMSNAKDNDLGLKPFSGVIPVGWATVAAHTPSAGTTPAVPATHDLDGDDGKRAKQIADQITNAINDYKATPPPWPTSNTSLRSSEFIDVIACDKAVEKVITKYDELLTICLTGTPKSFARSEQVKTLKAELEGYLNEWYTGLDIGRKGAGAAGDVREAGYRTLINDVIGTSLTAGPLDTIRRRLLNWPLGVPDQPDRVLGSTTGTATAPGVTLNKSYNALITNALSTFSKKITDLRRTLDNCRKALEFTPTAAENIDNLESEMERHFGILLGYYTTSPVNWAKRLATKVASADVIKIASVLSNAITKDPIFIAALSKGSVTATELNNHIIGRGGQTALNNLAGTLPVARLAPPAAKVLPLAYYGLANSSTYSTATAKLGKPVQELLNATVGPNAGSLRRLFNDFQSSAPDAPRLEPTGANYNTLEREVLAFAEECKKYANVGMMVHKDNAVAQIPAVEAALDTLNTEIQTSLFVIAADKTTFGDTVAEVKKMLNGFPGLMVAQAIGAPAVIQARPLTESQRLIHYAAPPTEVIGIVKDVAQIVEAAAADGGGGDVVVEAKSQAALEAAVAAIPADGPGPRLLYGLVVDKPGDMVALYKAVAIALKMKPPADVAGKVADRKHGATAWLYDVVRYESGAYYTRLNTYIDPSQYAVDV